MTAFRHLTSLAAACGLALLLIGGSASAQPTSQPAAQQALTPDAVQQFRLQKLRELHQALSIRPDQESAWQGFADSLTLTHQESGPDPVLTEQLTTPERLELIAGVMRENMASFERHVAAAKTLYAALSPEQRRAFDVLTKMLLRQIGEAAER